MLKAKISVALAGILACLVLNPAPAQATSAPGTWWTGHQACSNGVDNQAQYQNSAYQTRASGFAVYYGSAYIRQVVLTEYLLNTQQGQRTVNYTGSSHSAVSTDIPTTYLPWMSNYNVYASRADIYTRWSNGLVCTVQFGIGS